MTHTPERILRNTSIMIGALSLQKLIALFYFALVARWFGAAVTGEFFFATSVGMLLTVLFDFGQSTALIQESARDLATAKSSLRCLLALKTLSALVGAGIGMVTLWFFPPNSLLKGFLILIFFSSVFETLQVSFYGVLRAHQLHVIEGVAGVVGQALALVIGMLVWRGLLPMPMLIGAFLLTNVLHCVLTASLLKTRFGFSLLPDFSVPRMRSWLVRTAPFGVASYFVKAGTYTDGVLLRIFGGAAALGLYSIPFKTSFSWLFIPQGLVATLFPAMSFFAQRDREKLAASFHRAMELLLFLACPLVFGIVATSSAFIPAIFGAQYASSVALASVFAWVILPLFLQYPIGGLLFAADPPSVYTRLLGIATATNIIVNVLLIPRFGAWGAIAAALSSHTLLVVLGLKETTRVMKIQWRRLSIAALRVLLAALLMLFVVRGLSHNSLLLQVAAGFIVYVAATWIFGVWKIADVERLWRSRYAEDASRHLGVPPE